MNISEKVAYIKGLSEGLSLDETTKEGKLIAAIIDILDEYQNQGLGSKLMEALFEELKKRKVKGIMLQANLSNEGAVRFYKRLGFKMLSTKLHTATMGKSLE